MGVLLQRRKIPILSSRSERQRPATTSKIPGAGKLTPFGRSLLPAASTHLSPLIDPSYRLSPAYRNPPNKYYERSASAYNDRAVSPLNDDVRDDISAHTQGTHGSYESINSHSFHPNAKFKERPKTTVPTARAEEVDDGVSRASRGNESHAQYSQSTLGIPQPELYDQWLPHGKLPPSRSLSRGGVRVPEAFYEDDYAPPQSPTSHGGIHSDHGLMATKPAPKADLSSNASYHSAGGSTFAHEHPVQNDEIGYIVHSAPMGWKLTTPARKRFVEAAALLAGLDENEPLPMSTRLSDLPGNLGISPALTGSLRQGSSGPLPGFAFNDPNVKQNHKRAVTAHLDRTKAAQGGLTLKWMGADAHLAQMKKVDAKIKMKVSAANRPREIATEDYGPQPGEPGHVVKVGGIRTAGRKFRDMVHSESAPNIAGWAVGSNHDQEISRDGFNASPNLEEYDLQAYDLQKMFSTSRPNSVK
jgi:hypothetical protein